MPMPSSDETYIKVRCTPQQKRQIEAKAQDAGARSTNQFALTLLLEGNTQEYGSLRRKAEAPLTNAHLYHQLVQLNQTLQERDNLPPELLHHAIDLLEQVGRELVLKRLQYRAQQLLED